MIIKKSLSTQLYESLREDILNQNIGFGEKLVNRDLQRKYGISSTPVRDAINRLYLDGLLDDISNVGARVISFDYKVAFEVNEVMSMLNCQAVALVAQRADGSQVVAMLKQILQQQMDDIDMATYYEHDRKFHQTFFDLCGNSRIAHMYAQHGALWQLMFQLHYRDKENVRSNAIAQHRQIISAYEQGDVALAQKYMGQHFYEANRSLNKLFGGCVANI